MIPIDALIMMLQTDMTYHNMAVRCGLAYDVFHNMILDYYNQAGIRTREGLLAYLQTNAQTIKQTQTQKQPIQQNNNNNQSNINNQTY